ncbi:MAG: hypothetical protein MZV64_34980 [Ignavibacteriales bacterium]|nr:hypothetical protein [Ignavibacteriales bacterium]
MDYQVNPPPESSASANGTAELQKTIIIQSAFSALRALLPGTGSAASLRLSGCSRLGRLLLRPRG